MRAARRYCWALLIEWATLRGSYFLPLCGWVFTVIVAYAQLNLYREGGHGADFRHLWVSTYATAQIFPILIGGWWALMGENAGQWRIDHLIFPWPVRALVIRAGAAALSGGLWALMAIAAVGLTHTSGSGADGIEMDFMPAALVAATYHGAALAALTFFCARLLGSAPVAIGSVVATFILISPLLSSLGQWGRYLPGTSGLATVGAVGPQYLSIAGGTVVFGLWALSVAVLSCVVRQRAR
ncbi:MAG: hypothetical protein Q4C87_03845 [Actinomycetaceae bacterium]|nr:hypothetical protein [Actinomycetaceae bacterium]